MTTFNPVSYVVEAPRSLMVEGWDAQPILLGLLVCAGLLATALIVTAGTFRSQAVAR